MIGIPTIKWQSTIGISHLMMTLGQLTYREASPFAFDFHSESGSSVFSYPADYQRNIIVKKFLASKAEWLWFIDSDILPPDNTFELLKLLPEADVVAGIYPLMSKDPDPPVCWTCYDIVEVDTPNKYSFRLRDISREGEIVRDAGGAATGYMLIHRRVLEDARMYHDWNADPKGLFIIEKDSNGKPRNTEDLRFCRYLTINGYKLIVHTGVRCGHLKTSDVTDTQDAMNRAFEVGYRCGLARDPDFCRTERPDEPVGQSIPDGGVAH